MGKQILIRDNGQGDIIVRNYDNEEQAEEFIEKHERPHDLWKD